MSARKGESIMRIRTRIGLCGLGMVLALGAGAQGADTVRVAQGTLHGITTGDVTSFKGIPFAARPSD